MVYSDFTLQEAVQRLQLVPEEQHNLFAAVPEVVPGDFLCASMGKLNGLFHRLRAPTLHHRVPPPSRTSAREAARQAARRQLPAARTAQSGEGACRPWGKAKSLPRNAKGNTGGRVGEGPRHETYL